MELKEALEIVKKEGYIVMKPSKRQEEDSIECEESGCTKECIECSCSICIMQ